ncbi:MAG: C25 family cysteine peptidase, partial [Syntrophobacteraceae bacterium]
TSNPNKTSHANQITDTMLAHPHFSEVWRVLQSDSNRTTRVKNAFNVLGINAFTYVGHGTETAMSSLAFSTVTIAQLNGARKAYPFVHTVACKLGNFGHTSDCFAEAILKVGSPSAPAGAVAIAAATEDMYSGHGDRGQLKAFRELYYAEDVETFGSLFFKSTLYAVNCLTGSLAETLYRQWHLFGDCSLPIRKLSSYNAVITVELPAQATEGQGILTGQGRIKLSKAASSELVVDLTSSQPDKAAIPVSVVVPAGAIEVPFDIDIPDDAEITGTKSAEICASAAGWFAGCAGIDVLDNDGGLLVFSSATYVAEEDNQDFFVTLARIGDTHGSISVEINTCNGAASAGMDYLALAQTIIFEDGETEKAIPITIIDDLYQEADETFTVSLSGPFAGQLNTAVITIPFNDQVDYFTEEFLSGNDLSFRSLSLVPDGSVHYYSACTGQVAGFFTDPAGGTPVPLGDNSYARVNLADGAAVGLYGSSHSTLFIGGNGYITFLLGDTTSSASLPYHFLLPRISALFTDLDPSAGGGISCKQLADRVVVTFENVPEKETANSNSFQVELFFNGAVRITWLEIQAQGGIAGLSAGQGQMPGGFIQSDLSVYDACACN